MQPTIRTLILWAFMAALAMVGPAGAEDKLAPPPEKRAKPAGEENKEVVIQGVQRLKINVPKPEPDLTFDVDEIAIPYVVTEDSMLNISPTASEQMQVTIPKNLNSTQTASPHIQIFQRPPILTLRPRYKSRVQLAKWRLRITDGFGNIFRDFSGESSLPKEIIWDGRSKSNEMVEVGTTYSYIFSIIDVASNPTSQMGKPILLESLLYEEGGRLFASLMNQALLEKKEKAQGITKKGELYLREIIDYLLARQNYPLGIDSYAGDLDGATYNAETVRDYIVERIALDPKNIRITPKKSRMEHMVFIIN